MSPNKNPKFITKFNCGLDTFVSQVLKLLLRTDTLVLFLILFTVKSIQDSMMRGQTPVG
jgi:hypothetical protein